MPLTLRSRLRRCGLSVLALVSVCAALCGCHGDGPRHDASRSSTAVPPTAKGHCGHFSIAYDPANGYEASAFIVGTIAERSLDCDVTYVKTTARKAWKVVASGKADVYLDAYGVGPLRERLTKAGGPVTVVGPNGLEGAVKLLAPYFMGRRGLLTARDLANVAQIGWGVTTPAITTVPELLPLARSLIAFQDLPYVVRDFNSVGSSDGMGGLMQQPRRDEEQKVPDVYLVEAPLGLLGDRPDQQRIDIPESAAQLCKPDRRSTLCSVKDFRYLKIANTAFARSQSPAFSLVYQYELSAENAANILEIVTLSGYHVKAADVASWLNTHQSQWRRWLS